MTFKELAEQYLKDNPDGIWVEVHFNDGGISSEIYLDEYYMTEFAYFLNSEVRDYYVDDCDYEILEVFLK